MNADIEEILKDLAGVAGEAPCYCDLRDDEGRFTGHTHYCLRGLSLRATAALCLTRKQRKAVSNGATA